MIVVVSSAIVGTTASVQTDPKAHMGRKLRETAAALTTELGFVQLPATEGESDERVDDRGLAARRTLG